MDDYDDIDGFEEDFSRFGEVEFDETENEDYGLEVEALAARVQAARLCA